MKRTTKKVIFFSAMFITMISLFATAGRYRHGCGANACGPHAYNQHMNDCNRPSHHTNFFHWNDASTDSTKNN